MARVKTAMQLEQYTIKAQQRKYMKKSRRNLYVALEELDLVFDDISLLSKAMPSNICSCCSSVSNSPIVIFCFLA